MQTAMAITLGWYIDDSGDPFPFHTTHHGDESSCPGGLGVADQEADRKHHGHLLSCMQALTSTSKSWTRNGIESNNETTALLVESEPWVLTMGSGFEMRIPVCRPTSISEGLFVARQGHGGVEAEELTLPWLLVSKWIHVPRWSKPAHLGTADLYIWAVVLVGFCNLYSAPFSDLELCRFLFGWGGGEV